MKNQNSPWTWAVLVPAPVDVTQRLMNAAWTARFGHDEDELEPWEARRGEGNYTAILSQHPGSEGDDEELAVDISKQVEGEVYVLRFREGAEAVWVFADGRFVREDPATPSVTADRLGVELTNAGATAGIVTHSVCVVEGASVEAVRRALLTGLGSLPVQFTPTSVGTIVQAASGDASMLCSEIAGALPTATVYAVILGSRPMRFGVVVFKGEDEAGSFEAYGATMPGFEPLKEIKGETHPNRILNALEVPVELFS